MDNSACYPNNCCHHLPRWCTVFAFVEAGLTLVLSLESGVGSMFHLQLSIEWRRKIAKPTSESARRLRLLLTEQTRHTSSDSYSCKNWNLWGKGYLCGLNKFACLVNRRFYWHFWHSVLIWTSQTMFTFFKLIHTIINDFKVSDRSVWTSFNTALILLGVLPVKWKSLINAKNLTFSLFKNKIKYLFGSVEKIKPCIEYSWKCDSRLFIRNKPEPPLRFIKYLNDLPLHHLSRNNLHIWQVTRGLFRNEFSRTDNNKSLPKLNLYFSTRN